MTDCECRCHIGAVGIISADVIDIIEAAVACPGCRNRHCEALRSRALPNDRVRDLRSFDPAQWVDPPQRAAAVDDDDGG